MIIKCIEEIKEWIIDNHTYPKLIEWVPTDLLGQGRANFVDLGNVSQTMRWEGAAQVKIGWRHFLLSCPTHLTIDVWM